MTNKLVVINCNQLPKIKKILLYEIKFLVPNYSCLQNPWQGGYRPPDPRFLCPLFSTEFVERPPNKIPGYATGNLVICPDISLELAASVIRVNVRFVCTEGSGRLVCDAIVPEVSKVRGASIFNGQAFRFCWTAWLLKSGVHWPFETSGTTASRPRKLEFPTIPLWEPQTRFMNCSERKI